MNSIIESAETKSQKLLQQRRVVHEKQNSDLIRKKTEINYRLTEAHLQELYAKKERIENEIAHLQQKQIDRKKFLEEK